MPKPNTAKRPRRRNTVGKPSAVRHAEGRVNIAAGRGSIPPINPRVTEHNGAIAPAMSRDRTATVESAKGRHRLIQASVDVKLEAALLFESLLERML